MIEEIQELATQLRQRLPQLVGLAQQLERRLRNGEPQIMHASEAIYLMDRQCRIVLRNHAFFPEVPDLIGKQGVEFLPDGFKGICQLTDEFVLRLRQPITFVHGNPRDLNSSEQFETVKIPILDGVGRLQGIFGMMISLQVPSNPISDPDEPKTDSLYMEMKPELWMEVHEAHAKLRELSARQKSVVAMISEGLKQEAISRKLDISRKTVEKHREAASKKLDARSYADLIRLATLGQIISPLDYQGADKLLDDPVDDISEDLAPEI